ncbi:MAG: hypothetical protein ACJ731_09075 [Vicinamibacterales bacterium]
MTRSARSLIQVATVAIALAPLAAFAQVPGAQVASRDAGGELACGARAVATPPDTSIRVGAGRERGKSLFGPTDTLVIKAGTLQGMTVGQEYYVRRVIADRFVQPAGDKLNTSSVHTAGWVRIVDATADSAVAQVVKACDAIEEGDYLEPFVKPVVPPAASDGEPDFANPGHLVLGDERRQMAAQGDLMVLDRGSDHGLHPGQRVTIFRTTGGGAGPVARIAEGTALVVSPETSTIRIDKTSDAVGVGDLVAIHR